MVIRITEKDIVIPTHISREKIRENTKAGLQIDILWVMTGMPIIVDLIMALEAVQDQGALKVQEAEVLWDQVVPVPEVR